VGEWRKAFPDYKNEIGDIFADGDKITARFTFLGTNDGPFYEAPPTGNKLEVTEIFIWRFENGQVAEMWVQEDVLTRWEQLGYELKPKEEKYIEK
jgi:hypothetical protein